MISAHHRRSNARLQSVQQGRHANLRLEHLLHLPGQLCRRSCQAAGTRSSSSVRRAATALDRRSLRLRHAAHPLAGRERGFGRRGIVAGGRGHGEGGRWVRSDGRHGAELSSKGGWRRDGKPGDACDAAARRKDSLVGRGGGGGPRYWGFERQGLFVSETIRLHAGRPEPGLRQRWLPYNTYL